jgi:MATE family multidrug resistance protein
MNRPVPDPRAAGASVADARAASRPVAAEPTGPMVRRHVRDLLRLAWPVMLSRAGILVMAFVDIAMLGRYGLGAPGVAGLGLAIFVPAMVIAIGLVSGMVPVVARAHGAGECEECGRAWRRAVSWGAFVSLIGMWLVWQGETLLGLLDYPAEMAEAGGVVTRALAPGLLAQVLFAACAFYLEATRRPLYALGAMIVANVVNAGLNWVMIFGHLGWPEMGAVGAALASTIARFAALGLMVWFILRQADAGAAGVRGPWQTVWGPGGWRAGWTMRKLGASAGLSNGFETVGFAAMMMIAGTLGTAALDAYSISHNLVATVFMVGLGLSVATGVRVGAAAGAGDAREAAMAGWTGLLVALAVMGTLSVLVLAFRHQIVLAYTDVPELAARAAGVFLFSAFIFVPDTAQVVLGQAVRALGDAWVPVAAYVASFVVLMVPLGLWLTSQGGWDERGLVVAIIAACVLATVLLSWRFWVLTRRRA